jgi:hypothetical protein
VVEKNGRKWEEEKKIKRRYTKGGQERFSLYGVIIVITRGDSNKGITVLPPKN